MIKFVDNGEQMGGNGKSNDNGVNLPDVRYVSFFPKDDDISNNGVEVLTIAMVLVKMPGACYVSFLHNGDNIGGNGDRKVARNEEW